MCLYVTPVDAPSVATEDIEVFKVVERVAVYKRDGDYYYALYSPFKSFEYHIGRDYHATLGYYSSPVNGCLFDGKDGGLSKHIKVIQLPPDVSYKTVGCVDSGLHTYGNIEDAKTYQSYSEESIILRCVIPAGTKYYKGSWPFFDNYEYHIMESYASEALKVIEEFKEEV